MNRHQLLSCADVRSLDRRAIDHYGVPGIVLMENAGRNAAELLNELGVSGPVAICCGSGNNGGDGLVMARHLEAHGHAVRLLFWSDPEQLQGDAGVNFTIARQSQIPRYRCQDADPRRFCDQQLAGCQWIVDALLGTGARGQPRHPLDRVIHHLNTHSASRLALDIPSGLDGDTGQPAPATFRADHTCTFVAAKPGLVTEASRPYVGRLHVVGIGAPERLLAEFSLDHHSEGAIEGGS